MRLTHAITMQAQNRADLEVTVLPEGDALPITLEQDGGAINDSQTIYLSFEQYDVIAELVDRVRPELPEGGQAHHIPEVTYAICEHTGQYGHCVLSQAFSGHPRHVNAGGRDVDTGLVL